MKYLSVLLMIVSSVLVFSQEEYIIGDYNKIKSGDTKYLLFDEVNLRNLPTTDSKVVETLPLGSKVKIISKKEEDTLRLNGIVDYWYEVVLLNDTEKETAAKGYLWGGFFAYDMIESKNDPDVKFLFGLAKVKNEDWGEYFDALEVMPSQWGKVPILQLRAVMGKKEIARLNFEGIGVVGMMPKCNLLGNKGLRNVNEIFRFNINSNYCAGYFGDIYIFWDKAKLHFAKQLNEGFDAPVFKIAELIFPADEEGKSGIVVFYEAEGESDDDGNNKYEYQRKTELFWTGCEFKRVN